MKKLSAKKEAEIKVWEYFCLKGERFRERTDEDLRIFFEWSEQGKHKDRFGLTQCLLKNPDDYFSYANKLYVGKVWAGRTVHELWEGDFFRQDGSWPGWMNLLGDLNKRKWWQFWKPKWYYTNIMPREVVDWVKKEIFRGQDEGLIEECYQRVLKN